MKLLATAGSFHGSMNLTGKPIDVTPTMRIMPYTGKPAEIGEPDLNAGNGCKERKVRKA